jgi:hypothetical protein
VSRLDPSRAIQVDSENPTRNRKVPGRIPASRLRRRADQTHLSEIECVTGGLVFEEAAMSERPAAQVRAHRTLGDFLELAWFAVGLALPVSLQGVIFESILAWTSEAGRTRDLQSDGTLQTTVKPSQLLELGRQGVQIEGDIERTVSAVIEAARALASMDPSDPGFLSNQRTLGQAIAGLLSLSAARMMLNSGRIAVSKTGTVVIEKRPQTLISKVIHPLMPVSLDDDVGRTMADSWFSRRRVTKRTAESPPIMVTQPAPASLDGTLRGPMTDSSFARRRGTIRPTGSISKITSRAAPASLNSKGSGAVSSSRLTRR